MPAAEPKLKPRPKPAPKPKATYVGAPGIFKLEQCCSLILQAFNEDGVFGIYLVGSSLERADWRDVDVRMIVSDAEFKRMFPDVASVDYPTWEHDHRWLLQTVAISTWLREQTGLPIDFQIQPQGFANKRHDKPRHALGLRYASPRTGAPVVGEPRREIARSGFG